MKLQSLIIKIFILFTLFLTIVLQANSQSAEKISSEEHPEYIPSTSLVGTLLGSAIHPGISLGIQKPYRYTQFDKHKLKKTKTFYKERYLAYTLSMYHHNNYHTNYFFKTERISRRQKVNGFYFESSQGLGLSRTFVDGPAFTASKSGNIEKATLSGNWYGLACFGYAIGYNANIANQKPYLIFLKNNWLFMFPYNSFVIPRPTLELGVNYNLSRFCKSEPTFRKKTKQSRQLIKTGKQ